MRNLVILIFLLSILNVSCEKKQTCVCTIGEEGYANAYEEIHDISDKGNNGVSSCKELESNISNAPNIQFVYCTNKH